MSAGFSARQQALVRHSLSLALPSAAAFAELFYTRLFERDPALRPLFLGDLAAQGKKLVDTLEVFGGDLDRWEAMRPAMRRLGSRHLEYGARPEHYAVVGEVLLWTLAEALGEAFTPELREAWEALYGAVSSEMLRGAEAAV